MVSSSSRLDAPLDKTNDHIADIIRWIKRDGAYVVAHAVAEEFGHVARFFHHCSGRIENEEQVDAFLKKHRVIYIDFSLFPEILEEDELNGEMRDAGYPECSCKLKKRLSDLSLSAAPPYVEYLRSKVCEERTLWKEAF